MTTFPPPTISPGRAASTLYLRLQRAAAGGSAGVMAWERGRGEWARGRGGVDVDDAPLGMRFSGRGMIFTRPRSTARRPATVGPWAAIFRALPPRDHGIPQKLSSGKAREPACSADLLLPGHGRAPLGRYWITSSARCNSDCGIVSPRAFAVLRLITSSNLVGCSTGRSAGLAPFRILSTYAALRR